MPAPEPSARAASSRLLRAAGSERHRLNAASARSRLWRVCAAARDLAIRSNWCASKDRLPGTMEHATQGFGWRERAHHSTDIPAR